MSKDELTANLKEAKIIIFRYLKIRLRSEKEIWDILEKREFSTENIKKTITYFRSHKYIDDRVFAKSWINSRLKKPFGINRIQFELKNKGIDPLIIEQETVQLAQEDQEIEIVKNLAVQRWGSYKNIDPVKKRQRTYGYLVRRGFRNNIIFKVLNQL